MCVSLVQGNPVPLMYWFDDGLVVVRAQLNLNHIDEGLGYIVLSAFVVWIGEGSVVLWRRGSRGLSAAQPKSHRRRTRLHHLECLCCIDSVRDQLWCDSIHLRSL